MNKLALPQMIQKLRQTGTGEKEFVEMLKQSMFLCPIRTEIKSFLQKSQSQDQEVELIGLEDNTGVSYLVAFTSQEEWKRWSDASKYNAAELSYKVLKKIALTEKNTYAGIVVDPFGSNLVLSTSFLQRISQDKGNTEVFLGEPAQVPSKLLDALKQECAKNESIQKAYLLWMIREGSGEYILALDANANEQNLFHSVAQGCNRFAKQTPINIVSASQKFLSDMLEKVKPFYQKVR